MKKKKTLAILLSMTYLFAASFCLMSVNGFDNLSLKIKATDRPSQFDCNYYFNPANEFTSIYDINHGYLNGTLETGTYKTWGTVTAQWTSSSGTVTNTYIQSSSRDGYSAATLLYGCNTPAANYPIGSVIEVSFTTDNLILYNQMAEISGSEYVHVEKAYTSNPYAVVPYDIPATDWIYRDNAGSSIYKNYQEHGYIRASLNNARLVELNGKNAFFSYNTYLAYVYCNNDYVKDLLNNYLYSEVTLNVTGFVNFYDNKMQLTIRNTSDVVANDVGVKSIEVDTTDLKRVYHESDSELEYPTNINAYYTDGTNHQLDATELTRIECYGYDFSHYGYQNVIVRYTDEKGYRAHTSYQIAVLSDEGNFGFTLDKSLTRLVNNDYSDGNTGSFTFQNIAYQYYRANGYQTDSFVKLHSFAHGYGDALGGSFYNYDDLYNIQEIHFSYHTENSNGTNKAKLYYGKTGYTSSMVLDYTITVDTLDLTSLDDIGYFKFETGDCDLYIDYLYIIFKQAEGFSYVETGAGANNYRAHPNAYTGALTDGSTTVEAVVSYTREGSEYTATTTKPYTYYTYSYVEAHPECVDDASMITPEDVANYYSIFKKFPANYVLKDDYDAAYLIFGNKTRIVSPNYDRTTGYMSGLPWKAYGSTDKPLYHEFDIDLDGTYSDGNRSVGRVVAVESGFSNVGYGNGDDVICFFTDDHYATFQEYNNLGVFLPRFNRNSRITGYCWSEPTLLTEATA